MVSTNSERRKSPRVKGRFVISYRVLGKSMFDLTQTKDLSLGGMLLTTNCKFAPGTKLILHSRFPGDPKQIVLIGRVVKSEEVIKDLIYDTHLAFLDIDEKHKNIIDKTVGSYLNAGKKIKTKS